MSNVISAFQMAGLAYLIGILACGLVGFILYFLRKIISQKSDGEEQT